MECLSIDEYKRKDEQIDECREYSVSDIFCCGYAMYFWQGIQLRYPEYCQKQKSLEEILAEMERKRAENLTDGDEERYSVVREASGKTAESGCHGSFRNVP